MRRGQNRWDGQREMRALTVQNMITWVIMNKRKMVPIKITVFNL